MKKESQEILLRYYKRSCFEVEQLRYFGQKYGFWTKI